MYELVIQGYVERFKTVPGLSRLNDEGEEVGVLDYEPLTVQSWPTLYVVFDRFNRGLKNQVTDMTYFDIWRLCIPYVETSAAARERRAFINAIPAAIDQDNTLGGLLAPNEPLQRAGGFAKITSGEGGFVTIAGTLYLIVDYQAETLYKAAFKSGI